MTRVRFDYDALARTVEQRKYDLKITRRDVAVDAGVPESTLSRFLNRRVDPDIDTVLALCAWLGVSIDSFTTTSAATEEIQIPCLHPTSPPPELSSSSSETNP